MNVPNVSKKAHAHFIMNFIGQCVVANAPAKPHGKFRVVKSTTKPTRGFLKIVNGEYLPPAYTPSPPPDNDQPDTSTNDPIIEIDLLSLTTDGSKIVMETKLTNRDTGPLTFYAHAYTEDNVSFITLSNNLENRKSILGKANYVTEHRFEFDHVGLANGSVVKISQDTTTTYYLYVFVEDSDGDQIIHKETINRQKKDT